MMYVYILHSMSDPERFYDGITEDLKSRLKQHNAGYRRIHKLEEIYTH